MKACGVCRTPGAVQELDSISQEATRIFESHSETFWNMHDELHGKAGEIPDGLEPYFLAKADQLKATTNALSSNILTFHQVISLEASEELARIDVIDCGSNPVGCPKLIGLEALLTKIGDDLERFSADNHSA